MVDTVKVILISLVISVATLFLLGPSMLRLHGMGAVPEVVPARPAGPNTAAAVTPVAPRQMSSPNIEGLSVRAARDRWSSEGIMIIEEGERIDSTVKPGTILEQTPEGGAPLRQKEVRVIVSKAPEMVAVPDVVGKTVEAARSELLALGFEVPPAALEGSDAPGGTIIRQDPNANAKSAKGSIARLVVSENMVPVPKVTGKKISQARKILAKAGLSVGEVKRREHPELSGGRVLSQDPKPGEKLAARNGVNLVIVAPD